MLGGRGSERVRLSGRWRPDPESRSVVSKGWAKWKGKGPSPGTGKHRMDVRKEPWEPWRGGRAWRGVTDTEGQEDGSFPELGPLARCRNRGHPGRSIKTHQSTVGHERPRDPAGEWAAGERVRCQ